MTEEKKRYGLMYDKIFQTLTNGLEGKMMKEIIKTKSKSKPKRKIKCQT
jgi:uncharacterized protein (UPF0335 family)